MSKSSNPHGADPDELEVWAKMADHFAEGYDRDVKKARRECNKEDFRRHAREQRITAQAYRLLASSLKKETKP